MRVDARQAIGPAVVFVEDAELLEALQHDVVAAVAQPLGVGDEAGAATG